MLADDAAAGAGPAASQQSDPQNPEDYQLKKIQELRVTLITLVSKYRGGIYHHLLHPDPNMLAALYQHTLVKANGN